MELKTRAEAKATVLEIQQKLHRWSEDGTEKFSRIYNLLYNPNVLSLAWYKLQGNKGSRTGGTDKLTAKAVIGEIGVKEWLTSIETKLRTRAFEADTVRRCWIPKPNSDKMRPLGIPTLEDRLVQMALKILLEPIFEARFQECSHGFRPNRGSLGAIAEIRDTMRPRYKYEWVIEADFRSCFDRIPHGLLLQCVERTVTDRRILRLIKGFLKAGVMEDGKTRQPISGTPQGGIISPLLANIYLTQLDDEYQHRFHDLTQGVRRGVMRRGGYLCRLIRYADDFVVMVRGTKEQAMKELENLNKFVSDTLQMELAEEKTGIAPLTDGFVFLGYRLWRGRSRKAPYGLITILLPSKKAQNSFREKIVSLTSRSTAWHEPDTIIRSINRVIAGWGGNFRFGLVSRCFSKLDKYIFERLERWLLTKHRRGKPKDEGKNGLNHNTKKWIYKHYYTRDIGGRLRWQWKQTVLLRFSELAPAKDFLPWHYKKTATPYNNNKPRKTVLTDWMVPSTDQMFSENDYRMRRMESSLKRLYRPNRSKTRWRARCRETCTSGSGTGQGKRVRQQDGAPLATSTRIG